MTTVSPILPVESGTTSGSVNIPPICDLNVVKNHPNVGLINNKCGNSKEIRIVGGDQAKPGSLPWIALLVYNSETKKKFLCGGKFPIRVRGIRLTFISQVR